MSILKKYLPYLPIVGLVVYTVLFLYTTTLYPGGSINEPNAKGYSFFHNFLCDTMDTVTKRNINNNARFIGILSHLVLSFTMISFFIVLPKIFSFKNRNTKLITVFGVLSMAVFIFMFTDYHDLVVTLTGVLGTIALIPLFIEFKKFKHKGLKLIAYLCFFLSIIVFFSFETKIGFYYLPMFQKITFILDAIWVIWTCIFILNKQKSHS